MIDRFQLASYKKREKKENYLDNLLYLELLDFCLGDREFSNEPLRVLDVGARDWFYAGALWHFFSFAGDSSRSVRVTGFELDPYLTYIDGHSRLDFARFFSRDLPGMDYRSIDFLLCEEKADVVTIFHPFLRSYEHLEGGLPLSCFYPKDLILHSYSLLKEGGYLVIVNFDYETKMLLELLEELGMKVFRRGDWFSELADRPARHAAVVTKE